MSVDQAELSRSELESVVVNFLKAGLLGERQECASLARQVLAAGTTLATPYLEVIAPAMLWLGKRFEKGDLRAEQVRMMGLLVESVMFELARTLDKPSNGHRVMVIGRASDSHVIGGRMVSDLLREAGFSVEAVTVGAVPEGVLRKIQLDRPEAVCFSVGMTEELDAVRELIGRIRMMKLDAPPKIMVGGAALLNAQDAWKRIDADLMAQDAAGAVSCLASVLD